MWENPNIAFKKDFSPKVKELKIQVKFINKQGLENINTPVSVIYNIHK